MSGGLASRSELFVGDSRYRNYEITLLLYRDEINDNSVLRQFEILMNMPKVFANFSPGFEHRENPGT